MGKNKAVFLDRDGVINEVVYHQEMGLLDSPFTVDQIIVFPRVGDAINQFHNQGYKVILVSNQPGLAKDHFTMETFEQMNQKIRDELSKQGATLDGEYYCLHHPYGKVKQYTKVCACRKPKPGMLLQASQDHDIDLSQSWMIGDGITDMQAGAAAGTKTILIGRMKCDLCRKLDEVQVSPDYIKENLYKASLIFSE